ILPGNRVKTIWHQRLYAQAVAKKRTDVSYVLYHGTFHQLGPEGIAVHDGLFPQFSIQTNAHHIFLIEPKIFVAEEIHLPVHGNDADDHKDRDSKLEYAHPLAEF